MNIFSPIVKNLFTINHSPEQPTVQTKMAFYHYSDKGQPNIAKNLEKFCPPLFSISAKGKNEEECETKLTKQINFLTQSILTKMTKELQPNIPVSDNLISHPSDSVPQAIKSELIPKGFCVGANEKIGQITIHDTDTKTIKNIDASESMQITLIITFFATNIKLYEVKNMKTININLTKELKDLKFIPLDHILEIPDVELLINGGLHVAKINKIEKNEDGDIICFIEFSPMYHFIAEKMEIPEQRTVSFFNKQLYVRTSILNDLTPENKETLVQSMTEPIISLEEFEKQQECSCIPENAEACSNCSPEKQKRYKPYKSEEEIIEKATQSPAGRMALAQAMCDQIQQNIEKISLPRQLLKNEHKNDINANSLFEIPGRTHSKYVITANKNAPPTIEDFTYDKNKPPYTPYDIIQIYPIMQDTRLFAIPFSRLQQSPTLSISYVMQKWPNKIDEIQLQTVEQFVQEENDKFMAILQHQVLIIDETLEIAMPYITCLLKHDKLVNILTHPFNQPIFENNRKIELNINKIVYSENINKNTAFILPIEKKLGIFGMLNGIYSLSCDLPHEQKIGWIFTENIAMAINPGEVIQWNISE